MDAEQRLAAALEWLLSLDDETYKIVRLLIDADLEIPERNLVANTESAGE